MKRPPSTLRTSTTSITTTLLLLLCTFSVDNAFLVPPVSRGRLDVPTTTTTTSLFVSTSSSSSHRLPAIETMRVSEIRGELEYYGIPHRSCFEKADLVRALTAARRDRYRDGNENSSYGSSQSRQPSTGYNTQQGSHRGSSYYGSSASRPSYYGASSSTHNRNGYNPQADDYGAGFRKGSSPSSYGSASSNYYGGGGSSYNNGQSSSRSWSNGGYNNSQRSSRYGGDHRGQTTGAYVNTAPPSDSSRPNQDAYFRSNNVHGSSAYGTRSKYGGTRSSSYSSYNNYGRTSTSQSSHDRRRASTDYHQSQQQQQPNGFWSSDDPAAKSHYYYEQQHEEPRYSRHTSGFADAEYSYDTATSQYAEQQQQRQHSANGQQHTRERPAPTPGQELWIQDEMRRARHMATNDLRRTLHTWGIPTDDLYRHEDVLRAYAEAVILAGSSSEEEDCPYDPDFRDVVVERMAVGDPRASTGRIIDIELRHMAP